MSNYQTIPLLPSMLNSHLQHSLEYTISENSITAAEDVAACLINLKSPQNQQQQQQQSGNTSYATLYHHSPALIDSLAVPNVLPKQLRDSSVRAAKTNSTTLRQSQQQQQRQRSSPVKAQSRKAKRIRVTANNTVLTPVDALTPSATDMPHGIPSSLRYCAIAVCQKFRDTQQYTYNQLADSLINEFVVNNPLLAGAAITASPANSNSSHSDKENEAHSNPQSNKKSTSARKSETGALIANKATVDSESKKLRRRLYDTLNVLIAVDILRRLPDSKILVWQGYEMAQQYMQTSQHANGDQHEASTLPAAISPQHQAELTDLQQQAQHLRCNISHKRHALVDTTCRYVITQMLIQRNAVKRSGALRIETDGADDHETLGFVTPSNRWQPGSSGTHEQQHIPHNNNHASATFFNMEQDANTIPFPFLLCNASPAATLDICYNDEQSTVELRSDHPFSMNDDGSTLLLIAQALASQLNVSFDGSIRPDVTSIGQEPATILSSSYVQDRMRQSLPADVCQYVDQHLHSASSPVNSTDAS